MTTSRPLETAFLTLLLAVGCSSGGGVPVAASGGASSGTAPSSASSPTSPAAPAPSAPTPAGPPATTITTFADGLTPSAELHVSPTGDDQAGDGTQASPYATVGRALQRALPGTAIRLLPGTHAGGFSVRNVRGNAGAPIWIGGAPGQARPVIQGGTSGVQLSQVRYLVLHDLEIQGASANGVNCDDGGNYADPDVTRHVVFQNLAVRDVGTGGNHDGLKLSGVDDFFVLDCAIERIDAGSGIDMVGCHAGLIARSLFRDTGANAVQTKGGSRDVELRWCTLINPGQRGVNVGGSTGDAYYRPPLRPGASNAEASDIRVLGNVIVGGVTAFAFVGAVDSVAAHNTVIDPAVWLLRVLQERVTDANYAFVETQRCRVLNNVFYFARADLRADVNVGANTQPASFTFQNNLFHAHDAPGSSRPALPAADSGTILADPGFADAANGDYAIDATSPAAAAGAPQALLAADRQGTPYRPAPSVGAHEVR